MTLTQVRSCFTTMSSTRSSLGISRELGDTVAAVELIVTVTANFTRVGTISGYGVYRRVT